MDNEYNVNRSSRTQIVQTVSILIAVITFFLSYLHDLKLENIRYSNLKIDELASTTYSRLAWTELHLSSFARGADLDELRHRKKRYDDVYAMFNNQYKNLDKLKRVMSDATFKKYEGIADGKIWGRFGDIDQCLTELFDAAVENDRLDKDGVVGADNMIKAEAYKRFYIESNGCSRFRKENETGFGGLKSSINLLRECSMIYYLDLEALMRRKSRFSPFSDGAGSDFPSDQLEKECNKV